MYNQNKFLAHNAKNALENNRLEQEQRKLVMLREQKTYELKQLETQLFYKKQEVERLRRLFERLRREAVVKQNAELKEKHEAISQEHQLKDTEEKVKQLEQEVTRSLSDVSEKISKEKNLIFEHEKNLEALEKQKREIESKKEQKKRSLMESLSRIMFFKKKEEKESLQADQLFKNNQIQVRQTEHSLKSFSQEVIVLENKIRALRSAFK